MIIAVLLLLTSCADATDFQPCRNETAPLKVDLSHCDSGPCNFSSGNQVTGLVDILVDHEITALTPKVTEYVMDSGYEIPLPEPDGCKSLVQASCPIEDGETVTYSLRFNIPDISIQSPVTIGFFMMDQSSKNVTCFSVAGNIV